MDTKTQRRYTQWEEGHVKAEAEIEVMLRNAKDCSEPPEIRKRQGRILR